MKHLAKQKWIIWTALMLALPTAYFIIINILKEAFGISGHYEAIDPLLQSKGIRESLGWNINLLYLLSENCNCQNF